MAKDYLSQSGSSHERTIMLTESGRKSLVLEVLKDNQKIKNQLESEEEVVVEEEEDHQHQVETKESVEEEIAFNFSPPDEQTVSLSEEMRKSLAQTLARQHQEDEQPAVYEFSTGTTTGELFTFTNPEKIALSPPEEILSYEAENDEPEKEEEEHLEPQVEVEEEGVMPKQNEPEHQTRKISQEDTVS